MRRRSSLARRSPRIGKQDAIKHMEQRRELSRLVHGVDNEVLTIYYRFDKATFNQLATVYERLFGADKASYLRDALPAHRSGAKGVSGVVAARLMTVVPLFLTDDQRAELLTKMRSLGINEQAELWLYGRDSAVREKIKTVARIKRGATLPSLPEKRPAKLPQEQTSKGLFKSNATIFPEPTPPSPIAKPEPIIPTRLQDLPRQQTPEDNNPRSVPETHANSFTLPIPSFPPLHKRSTGPLPSASAGAASKQEVGCGAIALFGIGCIAFAIVVLVLASSPAKTSTPPTSSTSSLLESRVTPPPDKNSVAFFAVSKQRALSQYPDLIDAEKPLSKAVRGEVDALRAANDPELQSPDAPMTISKRVADRLGILPASLNSTLTITVAPGVQITPVPQQPIAPPPLAPAAKGKTTNQKSAIQTASKIVSHSIAKTSVETLAPASLVNANQIISPGTRFSPVVISRTPYEYVGGYRKKNGTYVAPHYRTRADQTTSNNYSEKGNVNPFTGKGGTK